jgi:cytochrome oxidase Cu insertion factor (SCO1/SenC/PrrC family)/tetratricopeptide (TPR) repeat protein
MNTHHWLIGPAWCGLATAWLVAAPLLAQQAPDGRGATIRLQIIVVDTVEQAQRLRESLGQGADFDTLARRESIDPTAEAGGRIGDVELSAVHPDLQDALAGLAPGRLSGVTRMPAGRGYAIFKRLGDHDEAIPTSMSTASALPLSGRAVVREPPNTSGLVNVEAAFRNFPKAPGWNLDPRSICAARRDMLAAGIEQLRGLTDPGRDGLDGQPPRDQMLMRSLAGLFESYLGSMDRAIARFEEAYAIARGSVQDSMPVLEEMLGSTYYHAAEMANGLYERPDDRCLFPPSPGTPPFAQPRGAEKAIEYFTRYLERRPEDLEVRWLLTLAYAALGRYPQGVPPQALIPREPFESRDRVGRFTDVARSAGLGGVPFVSPALLVDDVDADGLLDVIVASYYVCEHVYVFHNNGDGTFSDRSAQAGLASIAGGQGLSQADYDNDGCLDLLVTRGAWQGPMPVSLLRNDCHGGFHDVTREAGLSGGLYASQLGVWTDIDNDGLVDLFIGNEQGPSQLFHNRGDGTFDNISHAAGIDRTTFVKGAVAGDYDNDGYQDLFLSNQVGGDNLLYHNNRNGTFSEVARVAGVGQSWRSFATWFFDYDNDGWPDLFVASDYASVEESMRTYLGRPRSSGTLKLYRNTRDGKFADVTSAVGLDKSLMPMGANFGDLDNDGWLDIYLGTGAPEWGSLVPNVLLRNAEGNAFVDVTDASGTGEIHKTHGIAFADLDGSGQKTILAGMGGAALADAHALRIFRNPGNDNKWIELKLAGVQTNRAALGARIKVTVKDTRGHSRAIYRTVDSGGSFGASPLEQQIGLGAAGNVADIEVTWPRSGTKQRFTGVAVNQTLAITEGAPTYRRLTRKRFVLGGEQGSTTGAGRATMGSGMVLRIDAARGTLTMSAAEIAGIRQAGVGTFGVAHVRELDGLAPGALIDFTLVSNEPLRIDAVRVHRFTPSDAQGLKVDQLHLVESIARGGAAASQPALRVGEAVPDFTLIDQLQRQVRLSHMAGKMVAVSFMYTSCHLPDYCFRLTNNFASLQKRFADRLGRDLVLLTITFDPVHDQPDVLARYAADWKIDAAGWRLLGGAPDDVRRVCRLLGMNAFPEMGMVAHDLRTVVIGRDGRLLASIEGNEFTARQLGDLLQSLLD